MKRMMLASRIIMRLMICSVGYNVNGAFAQGAPAQVGAVQGQITNRETSLPIADATVTIAGSKLSSFSAADGKFIVLSVPAGLQTVQIRRLGYQALDSLIEITSGAAFELRASMKAITTRLDTIRIKSQNPLNKPLRLINTTRYDEFYERKKISPGGYQFTHEDLERKVTVQLSELFAGIPSMTLQRSGTKYVIVTRPYCRKIEVFLDNHPGYDLDLLNTLDISTVEAVEVYIGAASMPARARGDTCMAMFFWTR